MQFIYHHDKLIGLQLSAPLSSPDLLPFHYALVHLSCDIFVILYKENVSKQTLLVFIVISSIVWMFTGAMKFWIKGVLVEYLNFTTDEVLY